MVETLNWTADLSIGIELIDDQHRRIVDYINRLNQAREGNDKKAIGGVLAGLSDYTLSPFRLRGGGDEGRPDSAGYRSTAARMSALRASLPSSATVTPWARKSPPRFSIRSTSGCSTTSSAKTATTWMR
jgi:hypothetical protein